jgi:hypothetical protein
MPRTRYSPARAARLRRNLCALVAIAVVSIGLSSALGTTPASAMNPQQTTVTGTVNTLYWDLDAFWRWALKNPNYRSPTVNYFYGPTNVSGCGTLSEPMMMAYCPGNQIWVHYNVNQSKVTRLGDYAAGYFLAHEWGHHIASVLGLRFPTVRGRELYADCMAGVFTKYGYSYSHRLDASDYWEGMASLGDFYPYEGGSNGYPLKADRKAWYEWGFTSYSIANCAQAVRY